VFSHDPHHKATWDGKLGIWAFTEKYTAQRNNRNRKKGVVCVRNLPTIDRTVYKRYLLLSTCFPPSRKSGRGMTAAASFESSKIVSSPTFPSSTLPSWLLGLKVVGTSASPGSVCVFAVVAVPQVHAHCRRHHSFVRRGVRRDVERRVGQHISVVTELPAVHSSIRWQQRLQAPSLGQEHT
jgi:hypothetical protein